ncbi:polysaccharide biosynthesis/export family protein [Salinimicrobium sediminilitoris]|uniref:polysaccharide biosynthesis/export family protein n=1 Tax=Salinimicrobium sediminilitoris TaxID=2876715 RepID=UPI001E33288C|nr:polysaccharide biosynthesis/export family protein [Salinimicrobium sediminilitoris]MCC8358728.1 polysaccharide biosynthesis/export family protein [Salinimicrobium sediminilitoris]
MINLKFEYFNRFLGFALAVLFFSSCATRDEIVYFQGIEDLQNFNAPENFQAEIEVNDVLQIDVSSLNQEIVQPFIMTSSSRQGGGGQNSQMQGYLVDIDGNINFPVLGEVPVVGKTREELEEFFTVQLKEYVRDAVVRVRIMNFKVTVVGEIGSSVIEVTDERLSIIQAIAMAGDVSYDGKRENVLIVRMQDGKLVHGRVDLTSAEVFENPFYYLKQNDIVYVEPTYRRVKSAGFINSWQGIVSIITTGFSLFYLFNNI